MDVRIEIDPERDDPIDLLMRAHYHLIDNPRFWYDRGIHDASRIMCVIASDMRLEKRRASGT